VNRPRNIELSNAETTNKFANQAQDVWLKILVIGTSLWSH